MSPLFPVFLFGFFSYGFSPIIPLLNSSFAAVSSNSEEVLQRIRIKRLGSPSLLLKFRQRRAVQQSS